MVGELRSPREESTAVPLLRGHTIKLLSEFMSLETQMSAVLRHHQRIFSVEQMEVNTETPNWSKCRGYVPMECSAIDEAESWPSPQCSEAIEKEETEDCKSLRLERTKEKR